MQSTTGLIGRAIGLMRRRFPVLVGLAFWPYLTLVVFFAMIGVALRLLRPAGAPPTDPIETWRSMTVLAKLGVVLSFIAWTSFPWGLGTAGISLLVWHDRRGQEVSLGSVLVRLMRRLPSLLLLSFVLGGVAMFGLGILVLPGFIFFVASAFAVDVMTNEEAGVVRALERSISLVGDRIGTVLTLAVALGVIAGVLGTVFLEIWAAVNFEGFAAAAIMWSFIGLVPPALITVYATLISFLYCDVRVQRGEL